MKTSRVLPTFAALAATLALPLAAAAQTAAPAPTAAPAAKITYDEHIVPLFRNQCLKCHNPDKAKGDLDLSTFGASLKGGSSGVVLLGGDPDGSKLFKSVMHSEDPTMPPNNKLPEKELALIKAWIAGGLLENNGSKALVSKKPKTNLSLGAASFAKPDGPPPMPGDLLREPVMRTERPSTSTAMAASPWAPLLALGGQRQVLLYNTETFELAGVLPFPEGFPHDAKFSRNGKLLIVGGGRGANKGLAAVWDITTGERIMTAGDELDVALAADISSDQKWIALGGPDRLVKFYSTATGEQLYKRKKHTDWVTTAEFNPTSTYLATGDRSGGLVVWEADSGEELQVLVGHKGAITSLSWRSAEVLISSSEDGTVKTWDVAESQAVKSLAAHTGGTLSAHALPDGRMATCGRDKSVTVWDAAGTKITGFTLPDDFPVRVTLNNDGTRVIASDWSGRVYAWNVATGTPIPGLSLNPPPIAEQIQITQTNVVRLGADVLSGC